MGDCLGDPGAAYICLNICATFRQEDVLEGRRFELRRRQKFFSHDISVKVDLYDQLTLLVYFKLNMREMN